MPEVFYLFFSLKQLYWDMFKKLKKTDRSPTTILIRVMVGGVFLSEGIQKFVFPAIRGSGRFENIGIPGAELMGFVVGGFEIACSLFILLGLHTRLASIPLIVIMLVAIVTTKVPLFQQDVFEGLHESRTDFAMLIGSIFLLIRGGGKWSLDK